MSRVPPIYHRYSKPGRSSDEFENVCDEKLVQSSQKSDEAGIRAWIELQIRSNRYVESYSARLVQLMQIAGSEWQDISQTFFSNHLPAASRKFIPNGSTGSYEKWLFIVFQNFTRQYLRDARTGNGRFNGLSIYDEQEGASPGDELFEKQKPSIERTHDAEHNIHIRRLVESKIRLLPQGQQRVLFAYFRLLESSEGKPRGIYKLIAKELKMPEKTVKTYYFRAKRTLQWLCSGYVDRYDL